MKPIFLFSLPRSGSTLLQRVLRGHPQVATAPETWLLLPLVYSLKSEHVHAPYGHQTAVAAIAEFSATLPRGQRDYKDEIAAFAMSLYEKSGGAGHAYFLDKTPRYYWIVDEIIELFPDAKFIFLWRHPLAVAASMMHAWSGGKWDPYAYSMDLYEGLPRLTDAIASQPSRRILTVQYESLVENPHAWEPIFDYLELEFDVEDVNRQAGVPLLGRMGDPTGQHKYGGLSTQPLTQWREHFISPVRRKWAMDYLHWLGQERLHVMGYAMATLVADLNVATARGTRGYLARDSYAHLRSMARASVRAIRTP